MAYGDHIYVDRGLYTHHGIDMGDGTVIDFAAADGTKSNAAIRQATFEDFANGGVVRAREYRIRFDADQTVAHARSMLGRSGYDLFANNCEHFASWCVTGEHSSSQIEAVVASVRVVGAGAVAPSVGLGITASVGETAALSGPNLMSGLATLGGSAAGGIALLSGASGLLGSGTMCVALRDKPTLPDEERRARRVGRYGAIGGATLGVGISLHAVGALGVAGYSGAGLTSGLAALGNVFGGGMARGVAATQIIPVLFAVVVGYLLYRAARRHTQASRSIHRSSRKRS